jgi:RNA polymerase sigma-70 factor (ECF subfamily)
VTVNEREYLAERFEEHRTRLRAVAYRMLGSLSEVDDAVQEAWLRLSRADAAGIENLGGWLTTVVARVCLDMLRSRQSRREEPITPETPEPAPSERSEWRDPEHEALLADSVGLALLVVLDKLPPAERLAFVLHDMFGMPFDEIAPIVDRTAEAARQLASRARRRVRGGGAPHADLGRQREVVDAFIAALRAGDFERLLTVLDPDLVVRADMAAGAPTEIRGAAAWAKGAVAYGHLARLTRPALVNGSIGVVVAPRGKLVRALRFTIVDDKIAAIEIIGNPARLEELEIAIVD